MSHLSAKPIIGITCGDLNGIGPELIIKIFSDSRMLDQCTPVIYASSRTINFYRKQLSEYPLNFQILRDFQRIQSKHVYVFNCWEEEVNITPGQLTEAGGQYAIRALKTAVEHAQKGWIQGLVTAPIHKANTHSPDFPYAGHTGFLRDFFQVPDVLMLMIAEELKIGVVTEHIPLSAVASTISRDMIASKMDILHKSLIRDFAIEKPRIAVLGLNPHAGDEGHIGTEEKEMIAPLIQSLRQQEIMVFGPYPADGFFARAQHRHFHAVLAMYHDQGLIPFKSLAQTPGVNYTAGLPIVRTSPDHGTAFDIAGKNQADPSSLRQAIFTCIDILRNRSAYDESTRNPLKKSELMPE
ncbi:MAG: 4-hydroxythreonine-4-phosphate dehydrogenase PdxA [Thermoflavifilum sp.]|nr:4-hydroxythreonine-4-phosphate dehydrogenase PdxA [Thermoflavifilum sp.]